MEEQNEEEMNKFRKIFIYIVLYLLLALAFFSKYFVKEGEISTGAILMFIFGILSLVALMIIYTEKCNRIWAFFSISPFILLILFNLTLLYYKALDIKTGGGWEFFTVGIPNLFNKMSGAQSIQCILGFMVIFLVIWLIILLWKKGYRISPQKTPP